MSNLVYSSVSTNRYFFHTYIDSLKRAARIVIDPYNHDDFIIFFITLTTHPNFIANPWYVTDILSAYEFVIIVPDHMELYIY